MTASDPFAVAMQRRGEKAISEMPECSRNLPRTLIPLTAGGVLGVAALRDLGQVPAANAQPEAAAQQELRPPERIFARSLWIETSCHSHWLR